MDSIRQFLFAAKPFCVASVLMILFALLSPARLHAQGFGSVTGTITDATGAAVPKATVTATQTETGRVTTVTSNDGG